MFVHISRATVIVTMHGSDFTASCRDEDLEWYSEGIQYMMSIMVNRMFGPGNGDLKNMRVLNILVE